MAIARQSDREELRNMVASLRRHVQWKEQAGIRSFPRSRSTEKEPVKKNGGSLLQGVENGLFSDNAEAYQAKTLKDQESGNVVVVRINLLIAT